MPLQATSGAASYDAFGGGVPVAVNYIEDFFQSYLRTGTGASATVTTGLDSSTKETLVWTKSRSAATNHKLTDNVRGATKALSSNTTGAEATDSQGLTAFSATGYTIGTNTDYNNSGATYVDWQWVAQPKFFDIQTFTGNGVAGREISHALGSVPGFVIVKKTSDAGLWATLHKDTNLLYLERTNAAASASTTAAMFGDGTNVIRPTSTVFTVGAADNVNTDGQTYVAYLFAHNAGGFGLTGTDNVISCGSFTLDGSGNATVNLGYEPQWVMYKRTNAASDWFMVDAMRGFVAEPGLDNFLSANTSAVEDVAGGSFYLTSTGFKYPGGTPSDTWIYIAIRRGPMKVPTLGTSVFSPVARTGTGSQTNVGGLSFSPDLLLVKNRGNTQLNWAFDKLRGGNQPLSSNSTDDEATNISNYFGGSTVFTPNNTGFGISNAAQVNTTSGSYANWLFGRAPSFFDEVCYTGTGSVQNITHNLTVKPQLIIYKKRSSATASWWFVYAEPLGATKNLRLESTDPADTYTPTFNDTEPTSTVFTVGAYSGTNGSGATFVAYLFATCAGVSKVGSYTGNGSTQTINCGFTGGARFVLIKRTDAAGDWYVYDTARGMTVLTDPYLRLNSTGAEVATLGSVTTVSTGFALNSTILAAINVSGGTYIFLAIA
jgi:hypothetical protein